MSQSESPSWAPQACTLPTAEQPLRLAEFDTFFADAVHSVRRIGPGRLRLGLDPSAQTAARAADLMVREAACCSFFHFSLTVTGGDVALDVQVGPAHIAVLDALAGLTA